jgi:hypothetical protein
MSYLESDRGTYLLNTLNMASHRPLGVGIGDWQTQYPVYRLHNRDLWFNEEFQVRRAHSDHVQILGETGWPGILLWAGFLIAMIASCALRWCTTGHLLSLMIAAQFVALAAAMSVDYVIEHPFCKFQFFLIVFVALSADAEGGACTEKRNSRIAGLGYLFAIIVTCAAAVSLAYSIGFSKKILVSGRLTREYLSATRPQADLKGIVGDSRLSATVEQFEKVVEFGRRMDQLPGHSKSMFRDHLLVADSLRRLGRVFEARMVVRESLRLHPHHPPAFREMAVLESDSSGSSNWNKGYKFLMHEATTGYDRPYPLGHPLRIPD